MFIEIKKIIYLPVLFLLLTSCWIGNDNDKPGDTPWNNVTDFKLINTYNDSTRLTLLYPASVSGTINYIETADDPGITDAAEFNIYAENHPEELKTKTVTSDQNLYDNYITTNSYGSLKKVYLFLLYNGEFKTFSGTTASSGSSSITGSITGSTVMATTITLPAGYNEDTSKTWPLIVSLKGPSFENLPCITLCVNISWSNNTQYNSDLAAIKILLNSIVEGKTGINGAPARINKDKIYGFGFSAGGCAVMQIANDDGSAIYEFTAVVGVGISGWVGEYYSENMGDKNIWLFWGEDDDPWGDQTVTAYGYLPEGKGEHLLTEMYDTGHTSNPVLASPFMYMWLLSK